MSSLNSALPHKVPQLGVSHTLSIIQHFVPCFIDFRKTAFSARMTASELEACNIAVPSSCQPAAPHHSFKKGDRRFYGLEDFGKRDFVTSC